MTVKEKITSFYLQCTRVWHLLRKPSGDEFKAVSKVSALGILAIGAVGFLIADLIKIFFK
jgi:protein transport protein SEC61 subunit gamma and related proteins